MNCIGCDTTIANDQPAAYAIMATRTYALLDAPVLDANCDGDWVAAPVCSACFTDPAHRHRTLDAHFAYPEHVPHMLNYAGSSDIG